MIMRRSGGVLLAILLMSATSPGRVEGQDEAGARAAIAQLFEGMRTANPDIVRQLFAADARFAVLDDGDGDPSIGVRSVEGWISSIWAPYTFYLDGSVRHCGINSIELLHDADGWKVTQLSDTRRTENCPDPLGH